MENQLLHDLVHFIVQSNIGMEFAISKSSQEHVNLVEYLKETGSSSNSPTYVLINISGPEAHIVSVKDECTIISVYGDKITNINSISISLQNTIMNGLSLADRDDFERFLNSFDALSRNVEDVKSKLGI